MFKLIFFQNKRVNFKPLDTVPAFLWHNEAEGAVSVYDVEKSTQASSAVNTEHKK